MHQSYRHRGGSAGSAMGGVVIAVLVLALGGFLVIKSIGWFRASHEKAEQAVAKSAEEEKEDAGAPTIVDGSAVLSLSTGESAGVMYRRGTSESADYNTVLKLPALADGTRYEIWMVKDGLADVVSAGFLDPRADGTFASTFSLVGAQEYPTAVIMIEPTDDVSTPSGNIVAQGVFTAL